MNKLFHLLKNRNEEYVKWFSQLLKERLILETECYYKGRSRILDKNFDYLEECLSKINSKYKNLWRNLKVDVELSDKHQIPLGTVKKIKELPDLIKWIGKESCFIEPKIDGVMISIERKNSAVKFLTRGNGIIGKRVEAAFDKYSDLIFKGILRGEVFITKRDWKLSKSDTTPRNLTSGLINKKKYVLEHDLLKIFIFNKIDFIGEIEPPFFNMPRSLLPTKPNWKKIFKKLKLISKIWPIDGLIISKAIDNQQINNDFEFKNKVAYKDISNDDFRITEIINIKWQVGRQGKLTPVALVNEIILDSNRIKKVTLHNIDNIEKKSLGIGSKILISRSGSTIPYLKEVLSKGEVKLIDICPMCLKLLFRKFKDLYCFNNDCFGKNLALLTFLADRKILNLKGISKKTVQKLLIKFSFQNIIRMLTKRETTIKMFESIGLSEKIIFKILISIEKISWNLRTFLLIMNRESLSLNWIEKFSNYKLSTLNKSINNIHIKGLAIKVRDDISKLYYWKEYKLIKLIYITKSLNSDE